MTGKKVNAEKVCILHIHVLPPQCRKNGGIKVNNKSFGRMEWEREQKNHKLKTDQILGVFATISFKILSSCLFPKYLNIKMYKRVILSVCFTRV
jgi:hypothetical protein